MPTASSVVEDAAALCGERRKSCAASGHAETSVPACEYDLIAQPIPHRNGRHEVHGVIGDCRVITIGDAWQHEGHVKALQQLLMQRGLDQLALVDTREPWYRRLWAQLWGPAET